MLLSRAGARHRQVRQFASRAAGRGSRPRTDRRFTHYCVAGAATVAAAVTLISAPEGSIDQDEEQGAFSRTYATSHGAPSTSSLSLLFPAAATTAQCETISLMSRISSAFARQNTTDIAKQLSDSAENETLESRYVVDWSNPIGEGSFGSVYIATDKRTGEKVAVKQMTKKAEGDETFQREMEALMLLRTNGGHPNICGLRANYEKGDHLYIVLDLISGGEMFDHLAAHGAYSEADAARLIREVASALAFLHGLNVVHGDLKPENLMLSSEKSSAAVVKLVDFGSATIHHGSDACQTAAALTPAYCPPESLEPDYSSRPVEPSFDMWALGVIVYIMLTGVHPFDLYGNATDEQIEQEILAGHRPPTRKSPLTAHLSGHAVKLLEKLMEWDPDRRPTALELLENPWVQGKTARQQKMADSDKRLHAFKTYKTKLEAKLFQDMVESGPGDGIAKRTSLIERAFRELDPEDRGYVTTKDLRKLAGDGDESEDGGNNKLSLSGFSDLLSDSMQNKYFQKGQVVYREGDIGNHMYFINSGTISVETSNGSTVTRGPGDFFGEGALLHPKKIRSASIRCKTPVHAMEISREYFEKYMKKSDEGLFLELKEKDKIRKRNRSKMILRAQKSLKEREFKRNQILFKAGEDGESIFLVEEGKVDIIVNDKNVFSANKGNLCGEYSPLMGRPRNCTAVCSSDSCKVYEMSGKDFRGLLDMSPDMKTSLKDLCLRRDFKKAVVHRLKKEFPYNNPREAFDAVKTDRSSESLTVQEIRNLMRELNSGHTDEEIDEIVAAVKLTGSGDVSFDEFKKVFVANIKTSGSI